MAAQAGAERRRDGQGEPGRDARRRPHTRAQNGAVVDNVVIHMGARTRELSANNAAGTYNTAAECIIERDPDVPLGDVTYRFGGNFNTRLVWGRWRNLQLARTAGAIGPLASRVVLENCVLDNNGISAQINAVNPAYVLGLSVSGGTASLFGAGAGEIRMLRGVSNSGMNLKDC